MSIQGGLEVLRPAEMAVADRLTIAGGTSGRTLMRAAGTAVAEAAGAFCGGAGRVLVLAGPGNNGGDGYVAAELLRRTGCEVRVLFLGDRAALSGDAALASRFYEGPAAPLEAAADLGAAVIVDALFGAGLARDLEGPVAALVARLDAEAPAPVVAVDLPSGIDGATGEVRGMAVRAARTITFFRLKPGHLLLPGRLHCGRTEIADIGIPDAVLAEIAPNLYRNAPPLWRGSLRPPRPEGHKYDRGHCVVVSGPAARTGAARLAAAGALRIGAGLVTVASPPDALQVNAAHLTAIMLRRMDGPEGLAGILSDRRLNAVAIGPGCGTGEGTRDAVLACLASSASVVLDADALTAFADAPERLFAAIGGRAAPVVLTPHDGEFARLFPDLASGPDKVEKARQAAARSGAILVLKGADTIVAAPGGMAAINDHSSPWLATAGAGDVLTGVIAGLLAQGLPGFDAAAAGVWMHGDAALRLGPALVSEELPAALAAVWQGLLAPEEAVAPWR